MGEILKTFALFLFLVFLLAGGTIFMLSNQQRIIGQLALNPFDVLRLESQAFGPNGIIPPRYTCQGPNINPPITIKGTPRGTRSLAMVLFEPDRRNGTVYYWIVVNIDPRVTKIEENTIPRGGEILVNDFGSATYTGPCPETNVEGTYIYKIFALNRTLEKAEFRSVTDLMDFLNANNIGTGNLSGRYKLL